MKNTKLFFPLLIISIFFMSCSKDSDNPEPGSQAQVKDMKAVITYKGGEKDFLVLLVTAVSIDGYVSEVILSTTGKEYSTLNLSEETFVEQNTITVKSKEKVASLMFNLGFETEIPDNQKIHIKVYAGGKLVSDRVIKESENSQYQISYTVKATDNPL